MDGLVITFNETINNDHHVVGTFENKPFEMYYDTDGASGTVDGDFTDEERLQILTGWEMQREVTKEWATVYEYKGYKIEVLHGAGINDPMDYRVNPPLPGQDHDCNCLACTFSTIGDAIKAIDSNALA